MGRFEKLEPGKEKIKKFAEDFYKEEEEDLFDAHQYFMKGDEEYFNGSFEKSIKYYSKSLQLENSRVEAWIGQIYALIALNQYKEADLWSKQGLMLFPDNADIISLRGVNYAQKGFLQRAIGSSDFALEKGNSKTVWLSRAEILLFAKNKNSLFCFEKAMELAGKEDWKTSMRIGMIFYNHRIYSSALKYLTKACNTNPKNFYLWYLIGKCNDLLNYREKAAEAFKRSTELNPGYLPAKKMLKRIIIFSPLKSLKTIFKKSFKKSR